MTVDDCHRLSGRRRRHRRHDAAIVGGAAVVVYPALIATGVPPQLAAVSNLASR